MAKNPLDALASFEVTPVFVSNVVVLATPINANGEATGDPETTTIYGLTPEDISKLHHTLQHMRTAHAGEWRFSVTIGTPYQK